MTAPDPAIERLQRQIDSLSLVVEGLERRVAELDGGYSLGEARRIARIVLRP